MPVPTSGTASPRAGLVRALLWIVFVAALATTPVFLFAEKFDREHIVRVAASNGVTMVLCAALLAVLRSGRVMLVARVLVLALLALVGWLASTNGEDVHVNVVNFVLVTVLANVLLTRRELVLVATVSAFVMCGIAWQQAVARAGEDAMEARLESIAQFLPTYTVIVLVLALARRGAA